MAVTELGQAQGPESSAADQGSIEELLRAIHRVVANFATGHAFLAEYGPMKPKASDVVQASKQRLWKLVKERILEQGDENEPVEDHKLIADVYRLLCRDFLEQHGDYAAPGDPSPIAVPNPFSPPKEMLPQESGPPPTPDRNTDPSDDL